MPNLYFLRYGIPSSQNLVEILPTATKTMTFRFTARTRYDSEALSPSFSTAEVGDFSFDDASVTFDSTITELSITQSEPLRNGGTVNANTGHTLTWTPGGTSSLSPKVVVEMAQNTMTDLGTDVALDYENLPHLTWTSLGEFDNNGSANVNINGLGLTAPAEAMLRIRSSNNFCSFFDLIYFTLNNDTSEPPSEIPSNTPSTSLNPSNSPSGNPSMSMSMLPSQIPSNKPSPESNNIPSTSSNPSNIPSTSLNPSSIPSSNPSITMPPSQDPSNLPSTSLNPSSIPSSNPSITMPPSQDPSISMHPSQDPSNLPSTSLNPSSIPSSNPSISTLPSTSSKPSNVQSNIPSTSMVPSSTPSVFPSVAPSSAPVLLSSVPTPFAGVKATWPVQASVTGLCGIATNPDPSVSNALKTGLEDSLDASFKSSDPSIANVLVDEIDTSECSRRLFMQRRLAPGDISISFRVISISATVAEAQVPPALSSPNQSAEETFQNILSVSLEATIIAIMAENPNITPPVVTVEIIAISNPIIETGSPTKSPVIVKASKGTKSPATTVFKSSKATKSPATTVFKSSKATKSPATTVLKSSKATKSPVAAVGKTGKGRTQYSD